MDHLDYQILTQLKENARRTASEISKQMGVSVSTVTERIRKLEKSGVISSYTTIVNEEMLGNTLTVLMSISMEHPRYSARLIDSIMQEPSIVSCYYVTGEYDYVLKICCRSAPHLEEIYSRLMDCPGIRATRSHYSTRTIKNVYSVGALPPEEKGSVSADSESAGGSSLPKNRPPV